MPTTDRSDPAADPRAALAAAQAALLSALVAGADAPPGFDADRLRVQSHALLAKRTRQAAAHHGWLTQALPAADYRAHFTAYAAAHPLRAGSGGSHADATAFEGYLRERGLLPPAVKPRWWQRRSQ
ncbi:hypothetical protein EDD99_4561 [Streptomyces sp. 846.5]|nr:hypothetical protein EDD99_4561 [Streptomyces sp. 846.5]